MPCGYVYQPKAGRAVRALLWQIRIFCVRLLRCPFYSDGHSRASKCVNGQSVRPSRFLVYSPLLTAATGDSGQPQGMKSIGLLIKEELERQERPVSWFARKLYIDRSSVYRLFQKNSIDTALLKRISIVLNKDFFAILSKDYSEED